MTRPALVLPLLLALFAVAPMAGAQGFDATVARDVADARSDAAAFTDAAVGTDASATLDGSISRTAPSTEPPHGTPPAGRSTGSLARVTLGLFAILALTLIGGHPRVRAFERRAGIAMITGSGLPFLLLGVVARRPEVGILDDAILWDLRPFLEFGLGWIGFRLGTDFDVRAIDRWPRGTARVMWAESACAFLMVGVAMGVALDIGARSGSGLTDAIILGACAAVSAPTGVRAMEAAGLLPPERSRSLRRVAALDDATAVLVLALVTSAFRPVSSGAWALPPIGWLFLQIGMGVVHGALLVIAARVAQNNRERVALTLGAIAFSAGMAGYVGFSPLVVGAFAGVVVANLPTAAVEAGHLVSGVRLRELERTIFMTFFVVTGALWNPSDHTGWLLLPLYVVARLAGKLLGLRATQEPTAATSPTPVTSPSPTSPPADPPPPAQPPRVRVGLRAAWVALMPTSAVSIAVVVSARMAYGSSLHRALETVVIMGALAAEVVFRAALHASGGRLSEEDGDFGALPIEHDEPDGPAVSPPGSPSDNEAAR